MSIFKIYFGSTTHAGIVKEHNSDAVADFDIPDGHGFVVCDGRSGEQGHGALAAKLTAEEIKKYFYNRSYSNLSVALTNAVSYANYTVHQLSLKEEKFKGIGSTLAILLVYKNEVYYAYAGDSRIYFYSSGQIVPITRDHLPDNADRVNAEPLVLVGKEKDIKFGVCKNPILIEGHERFLICTDGLTDWVEPGEILEIIQDDDLSPEFKAVKLIEKANQAGGYDNVSVQIIEFSTMETNNKKTNKSNDSKSSVWSLVAILAIALVVIFIGYNGYKKLLNEGTDVHQNKTTESAVENLQSQSQYDMDQEEEMEEVKTSDDDTYYNESQTDDDLNAEDSVTGVAEDTIESAIKANQEQVRRPNVIVREEKKASEAELIQDDGESLVYYHLVEKGQNLFRIGLQYNVPLKTLEEINGEKATKLTVGEKLKIPVKALHKVQSGETLFALSKKYNSTVDDICKANKLDKNKGLTLGNTLVIPLDK